MLKAKQVAETALENKHCNYRRLAKLGRANSSLSAPLS